MPLFLRRSSVTQQKPDPIELFEGAVQAILPTLGSIRAEQLDLATPCTEWNVQSLINHNLTVQRFVNAVMSKSQMAPSLPPDLTAALPSEGAEAALRAITDTTLATLQSIDLEELVESPFGPIPGGSFIMFPVSDLVIHKWDLAKATGQSTVLDSGLAEVCFQVLTPSVSNGRERGVFGAEVAVPSSGSIQERLLGLTGRQP